MDQFLSMGFVYTVRQAVVECYFLLLGRASGPVVSRRCREVKITVKVWTVGRDEKKWPLLRGVLSGGCKKYIALAC